MEEEDRTDHQEDAMIQIDIEMPKCCRECFAFGGVLYGRCKIKEILFGKEDQNFMNELRPGWCPLMEVQNE